VIHHTDAAEPTAVELPRPTTLPFTPFERPLVFVHRHLRGRPSFAAVGPAVVDELRVLRAIYDVAAGAAPRTIEIAAPIATAQTVGDLL
jgi:hypothetical protein